MGIGRKSIERGTGNVSVSFMPGRGVMDGREMKRQVKTHKPEKEKCLIAGVSHSPPPATCVNHRRPKSLSHALSLYTQ